MTTAELKARVLKGVNEDATSPVYYTGSEVVTSLNDALEMFVLLTFCLETTGTLTVTTTWTTVMTTFPLWLAPLRIRRSGGKLRAVTLKDLDALDRDWQAAPGDPDRYAFLGFELLAVHPTPASEALSVTYAKCPVRLAADADVPEIRAEYHEALVDGAIPLLRMKEGAQEMASSAHRFTRFLDAVKECGDKTRARYRAAQYDRVPAELKLADLSAIIRLKVPPRAPAAAPSQA